MLIRFSARNYKSFGDSDIKLEMVSSSKIRDLPGHICPSSNGAKILRNGVIYGANASGKTNIIAAVRFMRDTVRDGFLSTYAVKDYSRIDEENENKETIFDIQIEVDGKSYDYGFSCFLAENRIVSEWLYELIPGGARLLFERSNLTSIELGNEVTPDDVSMNRFNVYKDDFISDARNRAALFLSAANSRKNFDADSGLGFFSDLFSWFIGGVHIIGAGERGESRFYGESSDLSKVAEVLASFDTGVSALLKEEITMDELRKKLPYGEIQHIFSVLEEPLTFASDPESVQAVMTLRSDDEFIGIERQGLEDPRISVLKIKHEGSSFSYDFRDESDGTRRLFDFLDMFFMDDKDALFLVDELDRSFHPMLTQQLVTLFNELHQDDCCQLVFTTHENSIMSFDYFRRDEFLFVERGDKGYSRMYPLDDFVGSSDVRSDTRLNKRYMEGRYGGVPILSKQKALDALKENA